LSKKYHWLSRRKLPLTASYSTSYGAFGVDPESLFKYCILLWLKTGYINQFEKINTRFFFCLRKLSIENKFDLNRLYLLVTSCSISYHRLPPGLRRSRLFNFDVPQICEKGERSIAGDFSSCTDAISA
jgi:hypothetical protein